MTDRITDTRTHKENIDKLSVQGGPFDAWGPNSTYQKAIDPLSEDASPTKERKELHKRLLDKYKETHGYDNIDTGRKTIMMAGAPEQAKALPSKELSMEALTPTCPLTLTPLKCSSLKKPLKAEKLTPSTIFPKSNSSPIKAKNSSLWTSAASSIKNQPTLLRNY